MEERRGAVRRDAAALAALLAAAPAAACELPGAARVLESPRVALAYRTIPQRISVGERFTVEFAVCPKGREQAGKGEPRISANAHMPEHRHGMNYRPTLSTPVPGRYRSEGWLFHMPVALEHRNFGEFKVPGLRNVAQTAPSGEAADLVALLESLSERASVLPAERPPAPCAP